MDNAELAIGIDLGTTNSLIAVWKDGAAQLIPNKFGEYLTPSIISMDENNHILVGKPAVSRRTSHPDKTAALFKRAMGSNTNWRLGSDTFKEGANKRGNSSRLTQSFHFFMFEPIFSPVNALNQPI